MNDDKVPVVRYLSSEEQIKMIESLVTREDFINFLETLTRLPAPAKWNWQAYCVAGNAYGASQVIFKQNQYGTRLEVVLDPDIHAPGKPKPRGFKP
jgi:hypothetical protein